MILARLTSPRAARIVIVARIYVLLVAAHGTERIQHLSFTVLRSLGHVDLRARLR